MINPTPAPDEELKDHHIHPVIQTFAALWSDFLDQDDRNRLLTPLIWDTIGTNNQEPEVTNELAWMTADWLARVQAPAWLRLAGHAEHAESLATLAPLTADSTPSIMPTLKAVRSEATTARNKSWDAIQRTASGPAWHAATWKAADDAIRATAGRAAWAIARDDDLESGGDDAWVIVATAALLASWNVARNADEATALATAQDALKTTVTELQDSAAGLLARMCTHAKAETDWKPHD